MKEPWLKRAIDIFDRDDFKDGDLLSKDWVVHALDVPPARSLRDVDDVQWMLLARVEALKEYLLTERKIALRTVRGKGFQVVPPAEQAEFAAREAMAMVQKGLKKGAKLLECTRTERLTDEEKRRHVDAEVRLSGISGMMARQKRDVFRLFAQKSHEANP